MPDEGPFAGTHFCAADALVTRVDTFRHTLALSSWTSLGSCPAPGSGTIVGCHNQTEVGAQVTCVDEQFHIVGDIGNVALDLSLGTNAPHIHTATTPAISRFTFGTGGLLTLSTTAGTGSGFMILPQEASQPGLVVCIGEATLTQGFPNDRFTFTLDELGVVGTCPGDAATGQIEGCL